MGFLKLQSTRCRVHLTYILCFKVFIRKFGFVITPIYYRPRFFGIILNEFLTFSIILTFLGFSIDFLYFI